MPLLMKWSVFIALLTIATPSFSDPGKGISLYCEPTDESKSSGISGITLQPNEEESVVMFRGTRIAATFTPDSVIFELLGKHSSLDRRSGQLFVQLEPSRVTHVFNCRKDDQKRMF